jgi:hypothetical protein
VQRVHGRHVFGFRSEVEHIKVLATRSGLDARATTNCSIRPNHCPEDLLAVVGPDLLG